MAVLHYLRKNPIFIFRSFSCCFFPLYEKYLDGIRDMESTLVDEIGDSWRQFKLRWEWRRRICVFWGLAGEDEWEDVDEVASDGHSDDGGDEEPLQDMDMVSAAASLAFCRC